MVFISRSVIPKRFWRWRQYIILHFNFVTICNSHCWKPRFKNIEIPIKEFIISLCFTKNEFLYRFLEVLCPSCKTPILQNISRWLLLKQGGEKLWNLLNPFTTNDPLVFWCFDWKWVWKWVNKNCVKSVSIRSYSGPHFPVFSPNEGKSGPQKLQIRRLFTQWKRYLFLFLL